MARGTLSIATKQAVLIEAGYRCAIPTCRGIIAMNLHHIVPVADGGEDDPANLIALCPTCHQLHHQGHIPGVAILAYKRRLEAISKAFDVHAVDCLLAFTKVQGNQIGVTGDGLLSLAGLIASGYLAVAETIANGPLISYRIRLTQRGVDFLNGWLNGRDLPA